MGLFSEKWLAPRDWLFTSHGEWALRCGIRWIAVLVAWSGWTLGLLSQKASMKSTQSFWSQRNCAWCNVDSSDGGDDVLGIGCEVVVLSMQRGGPSSTPRGKPMLPKGPFPPGRSQLKFTPPSFPLIYQTLRLQYGYVLRR